MGLRGGGPAGCGRAHRRDRGQYRGRATAPDSGRVSHLMWYHLAADGPGTVYSRWRWPGRRSRRSRSTRRPSWRGGARTPCGLGGDQRPRRRRAAPQAGGAGHDSRGAVRDARGEGRPPRGPPDDLNGREAGPRAKSAGSSRPVSWPPTPTRWWRGVRERAKTSSLTGCTRSPQGARCCGRAPSPTSEGHGSLGWQSVATRPSLNPPEPRQPPQTDIN